MVHALFYCPSVIDYWSQQVPSLIYAIRVYSFPDLASWVRDKGCDTDLKMFFLIAWDIWYRRNNKTYEGKEIQHEQIVVHVLSMQKEFQEIRSQTKKLSYLHFVWSHPQSGALKLNVDGANF